MGRRSSHGPPISLFSFQDIITSVAGIIIFLTLMMAVELIRAKHDAPAVHTQHVLSELERTIPELERELRQVDERLAAQQSDLDATATATPAEVTRQSQEMSEQIAALTAELRELAVRKQETQRNHDQITATLATRAADQLALAQSTAEIDRMTRELKDLQQSDRIIYTNSETSKTAWLVEVSGQQIRAMRAESTEVEKQFAGGARELVEWVKGLDARNEYVVVIVKPSGIEAFERLESRFDEISVDIGFDLIDEQQTILPTGEGV